MSEKKVIGWFTMNGKHIPVFEGESKADAAKRSLNLKKAPGKDKQPVPKGHTDKKWKEFEEASHKAEIMSRDIEYPEFAKKERETARAFDKSVAQEREYGTISIKRKKKSIAEKNEDIKNKQIAENKRQAEQASGKKLANENSKWDKSIQEELDNAKKDPRYLKEQLASYYGMDMKDVHAKFDKFTDYEKAKAIAYALAEDVDPRQTAKERSETARKLLGDSSVTRKDVEELTAKKNALKNANLKTKPITKKEIDKQKKTWSISDKTKARIDSYAPFELRDSIEDNADFIRRAEAKLKNAKYSDSESTKALKNILDNHKKIQSYMEQTLKSYEKDAQKLRALSNKKSVGK